MLILFIQSTLALQTPRYYGHPIIRTAVNLQLFSKGNSFPSSYYGLSLLKTLTLGSESVPISISGFDCIRNAE